MEDFIEEMMEKSVWYFIKAILITCGIYCFTVLSFLIGG